MMPEPSWGALERRPVPDGAQVVGALLAVLVACLALATILLYLVLVLPDRVGP